MKYKFNVADKVCYRTPSGNCRTGIVQSCITKCCRRFYDIKVEGLKNFQRIEEGRIYRLINETKEGLKVDNNYCRQMFKQELEYLLHNMNEKEICPKYILAAHMSRLVSYFAQIKED